MQHFSPTYVSALFIVVLSMVVAPTTARGQGGCGSVCVPLESLDPERAQVIPGQFRVAVTSEYADFDRFVEGGSTVTNSGGNQAIIHETAVFLDYGATARSTVSVMLPYIRKIQRTNRFGERSAVGLGDVAVFGRYEVLFPTLGRGPSLSVGLGVKFPTGSIDEPGGDSPSTLPPAFQNGSGAYDVLPTLSYFQNFAQFSVFGSSFLKVPLGENHKGYEFGREFEAHLGVLYPLPILGDRLSLLLSLDHLTGGRDTDSQSILPGRIREGTAVLNTGGSFTAVTPGVRMRLAPGTAIQARVFIPVHENWNGQRTSSVGQVAPDLTGQITIVYSLFR